MNVKETGLFLVIETERNYDYIFRQLDDGSYWVDVEQMLFDTPSYEEVMQEMYG